jgi:hypothetical protein
MLSGLTTKSGKIFNCRKNLVGNRLNLTGIMPVRNNSRSAGFNQTGNKIVSDS